MYAFFLFIFSIYLCIDANNVFVDLTKERINYLYFKTYTNHTQIFEFNKSYPIDKAKRLGASAFLML